MEMSPEPEPVCSRLHAPLRDPAMTRHQDGTVSIDWGEGSVDLQRDYVLVPCELVEKWIKWNNEVVLGRGAGVRSPL